MSNATSSESAGLKELTSTLASIAATLKSIEGTLESLNTRLVGTQPDFFPWTGFLDAKTERRKLVEKLMQSQTNGDGSFADQLRSSMCAQAAMIGLLVELLDRPEVQQRLGRRAAA